MQEHYYSGVCNILEIIFQNFSCSFYNIFRVEFACHKHMETRIMLKQNMELDFHIKCNITHI